MSLAQMPRLPRPVERAPSPMEVALEAMRMGKARQVRQMERRIAHNYERVMLRNYIHIPEHWLSERYEYDPFITRAIIRRLRIAIIRHKRLPGYIKTIGAPLDRGTRLRGMLGGELLKLGRNVVKPEDI